MLLNAVELHALMGKVGIWVPLRCSCDCKVDIWSLEGSQKSKGQWCGTNRTDRGAIENQSASA